jgi:ATP-binding cassette, subfamily C (CFTR/MRP), member 1
VLEETSFSIRAGEKVAIVGRTGSGKSSLVNALFGEMDGMQGTIQIDGLDLSKVPRRALRERLVGLGQFVCFSSRSTLRSNLDPAGLHDDAAIQHALRGVFAGVPDHPHDFDLDRAWKDCNFSPGWQQRIAIARALLRRSTVYIFDEPTSGWVNPFNSRDRSCWNVGQLTFLPRSRMDADTHRDILEVIFRIHPTSTIVMVTHHEAGLDMFDWTVALGGGVG